MDVSHVILVWPWLYDKDFTIHGRMNTCQFEHEGKKIKLLPREPNAEPSEPKPTTVKNTNTISLITAKAFSQDVEKGASFVILATKKITKEFNTVIPPEVTPVISEFADVFPEDLPDKLPPMRDIQRAVDLVSRANLADLPHYRMYLTEHTELKMQVDELMRKGFI